MKKFWRNNKEIIYFISTILFFWYILLFIGVKIGEQIPLREKFIGPIPQANMDGIHYLYISHSGYSIYQQAFFPFFPLMIRFVSFLVKENYLLSAEIVVNMSLIIGLFAFHKLLSFDYSTKAIKRSLIFMLFFPTGFFFGAIYTESLFMMLVFLSFLAARKKMWAAAGFLAAMSSFTKFVGVFLFPALIAEYFLIERIKKDTLVSGLKRLFLRGKGILLAPLGLLSYMIYLWYSIKDPFAFLHVQAFFGANRSVKDIVFLPQVLYRYLKILTAISLSNFEFWVAVLELSLFLTSLIVLCKCIKSIRLSYFIFSLLAVVVPTLTGTLSSEPRYVLVAFPVFTIFASLKNKTVQRVLLSVFLFALTILYAFFSRGYFIA